MRFRKNTTVHTLSSESIDLMSGLAASFLEEQKIERKEIIKTRLSMEDALLVWQDKFGKDAELTMDFFHRFGKEYIKITHDGEQCNPFNVDEDLGIWTNSIRASLQSVPTYDYYKKNNTITFCARRPRMSKLLVILIFLFAGVLFGVLGMALSVGTREAICDTLLVPIYETYLKLFNFFGIPLIFLSVLTGILGVGDIHSFSLIGRNMIAKFLGISAVTTFLSIAVGLLCFPQTFGQNSAAINFKELLEVVLGWLPQGLFQPFIECNAMQLVILGMGLGIAILYLDGGQGYIGGFFNDLNSVMVTISIWATELIPFFVFVTIVKSIWLSETDFIFAAWRSWLVTTSIQVIVVVAIAAYICKRHGLSLSKIFAKVSKIFVIALGTNSCGASIPANYEICEVKLGIDPKVFVFGIPIGTSVFKPATAARLVFLCLFVMWNNKLDISASWLLLLFFMSMVLSVATPAIPGGTLMLCGMLFTQLGMPEAALAQMLTTDVFFDCVCTAFNQISVTLGLTAYGSSIGLINEDVLKQ